MTEASADRGSLGNSGAASWLAWGTAFALGGLLIRATYEPADSTSIESGDGLWFCEFAVLTGTLGWLASAMLGRTQGRGPVDWAIDVAVATLGVWIMIAAFATSPPGNLRMASNEAWFWVAGAVLFTGIRRLAGCFDAGVWMRWIVVVVIAVAAGQATITLHQLLISLPADRAAYDADPDAVLAMVGIEAPPGSAARMAFENRLRDGGPTGTFALANSLAGVLVLGLVLLTGTCRRFWLGARAANTCLLLLGILLIAAALIATRSRTGVLVGFAMTIVLMAGSGGAWKRHWRSIAGIGLVLLVAAGCVLVFGDREWIEEAPASLAFRFQYWQTTLSMVADRPWFGVGPGNFKAIYEAYRAPEANEQIAEPHNFLMETLAAGGWIALTGLATAGGLIAGRMTRMGTPIGSRIDHPSVDRASSTIPGKPSPLWAGAIVGCFASLLLRVAGGSSEPGVDMVALAIGGLAGWSVANRYVSCTAAKSEQRGTIAIGVLAVLLHLCFSGGWTVPGVAAWVWVLTASVVPVGSPATPEGLPTSKEAEGSGNGRPGVIAAILLTGLGLLLTMRFVSLGPVSDSKRSIRSAEIAQQNGLPMRVLEHLDAAIVADRWSFDAALLRADATRWVLVQLPPDRSAAVVRLTQQWRGAAETAVDRAGQNPALLRQIIEQQLHLYQRFGDQDDLSRAEGLLEQSTRLSPSHQWHHAQLAAVRQTLGHTDSARRAAGEARRLSRLGNNLQRFLDRQLLVVPVYVGEAAAEGPLRRPADRVLQNLLEPTPVEAAQDARRPDRIQASRS